MGTPRMTMCKSPHDVEHERNRTGAGAVTAVREHCEPRCRPCQTPDDRRGPCGVEVRPDAPDRAPSHFPFPASQLVEKSRPSSYVEQMHLLGVLGGNLGLAHSSLRN